MTGTNWTLEDDLATITVTFPTDPPATLRLRVSDVEGFLKNLGDMRSVMSPPTTPSIWPLGQHVDAIPDPRWAAEPDLMLGYSLLHILDPRYGWLHYVLPREEARRLGQILQNQADGPPLGQIPGKAN